jgi:O-antigen/teichoic acid export membrane protein
LLVLVYETVDIFLLSRLAGFADVGYYSGAQRFIWPLLLVQQSIGGTMYSVIASHWPSRPRAFENACQRCFETVLLVGGIPIVAMVAGPYFFMGLLGHRLLVGAPVLRILAVMCLVKAVSSTIGPVLYIVKAQKQVLRFITAALIVKTAVAAVMAYLYGFMGTAAGALAVDIFCVAAPSIYLVQSLTSYRVRWGVPLKVLGSAAVASFVPILLVPQQGLAAAVLAPVIYIFLVFAGGAVRIADLLLLLKREPSVLAAVDACDAI